MGLGKTEDSTIKYRLICTIEIEGVVDRPDIIGAVFGQTEGLLTEDLDLRELQRSGRIGRIGVQVSSKQGVTKGKLIIPSSLDRVETAILAATIETVDRVGPCNAKFTLNNIEDVRIEKRETIVSRASQIVKNWAQQVNPESFKIADQVSRSSRMGSVKKYGPDSCPAGPTLAGSDEIIIVEGRADIINLMKAGITNTIAVEGTQVPKTVIKLCKSKAATAFLDGDRGGDFILKELLQVGCDIDRVARAPLGKEVEDLSIDELESIMEHPVDVTEAVFLTGNDRGKPITMYADEKKVYRPRGRERPVRKQVDKRPSKSTRTARSRSERPSARSERPSVRSAKASVRTPKTSTRGVKTTIKTPRDRTKESRRDDSRQRSD
ncbi:MAG: DNA primase, partial [Candidatus Heimdallarchaeota archaeon]|nr:DNA primase [Candidatus Heimdallarchaeota archaeon]MCK5049921.1 DNA primase [Candidatus Heimdallarchaeota archaeon]